MIFRGMHKIFPHERLNHYLKFIENGNIFDLELDLRYWIDEHDTYSERKKELRRIWFRILDNDIEEVKSMIIDLQDKHLEYRNL